MTRTNDQGTEKTEASDQKTNSGDSFSQNRKNLVPPIWKDWTVDGSDDNGEKIQRVIGSCEYYYVYYGENGWLNWRYSYECICRPHQIVAESQIILNSGKAGLVSTEEFKRLRLLVATAMIAAFENYREGEVLQNYFLEARKYLDQNNKQKYRQYYFSISTVVTIFLVLLLLLVVREQPAWLTDNQEHLLVGSICGCFGAYMSVLHRFDTFGQAVEQYKGMYSIVIEALSRLLIGFGFGAIIIVCHKAGILFPNDASNLYFIALAGLIAGFNERFVPTILARADSIVGSRK